mgnify:FL=1
MKTNLLKRIRQHFGSDWVPEHVKRHNMRAYIRARRFLGDKWLLAKPVARANQS